MHQNIPEEYMNQIVTGDARVLAERIPDESVDLIFTDPIYWNIEDYAWLAELGARVLKNSGSLLAYAGNIHAVRCAAAMLPYLDPCPVLAHYVIGPTARLFSHSLQCNLIPLLWFSKKRPRNDWMSIQQSNPIDGSRGHDWGKNWKMLEYRIEKFTEVGAVILDPFSGGGTLPAVAKMMGRNFIAFEINPETAAKARTRLENTQAMQPIFLEEQKELFAV